jgi:large subunit ribosomal protein L9
MKVILNQDVPGLGEEGDIKDVTGGYARNYLLPKNFALPYTKQNLTQLETRRSAIESRKEEKRREAMSIKERLESEELTFSMPAGDSGKLFGSVNSAMVVQELDKRGYSIEKKRIEVPEHNIRMIGNYTVKVKLYGNEEARLNVVVEAAEDK